MPFHTISSDDFSRDVGAARRSAAEGPVFITDQGRPAFVWLTIQDYRRLAGQTATTLLEMMDGIDGGAGIEWDPPGLRLQVRPAGFS